MTYAKYNVKDNAYGNLLSGIWASTTTINLESWDGARFPASNFIATLVKYTTTGDDTTPILASEKILVVSRSTDTLTVTRWFDWSTPTSFDAGDNIYVNVVSSIIEDIQDEVTRLGTDKLDVSSFNSTLRNNLGNWKVIYTNGTGDEIELPLWASWNVLKSNWSSSAPTWEAPTVDINWLTDDSSVLDTNDRLLMYNGITNVQRAAKASTTIEGMVERLTDAEDKIGTDEERYGTAKQNAIVYHWTITINTTSRNWSWSWTTNGTTITTTKRTIWRVTISAWVLTTSTLQQSSDWSTWSDLYQVTPSWTAIDAVFMMAPNHYYRWKVVETWSGGWVWWTVTLQYTV